MSNWPPVPPPQPPGPSPWPQPRPSPWHPEPHPSPGPAPSTVVSLNQDWLGERLLDRRIVSLAGRLDAEAANRAAASLALLDASGDDPIGLRLCDLAPDPDSELDTVLTLLDTIDLLGVPLHATCLGGLTGTPVALLAIADQRTAGAHATITLREPRTRLRGPATDVATHAEDQRRQLRQLQQRVAAACHRDLDTVSGDMRAGRVLSADQARDYGLLDAVTAAHQRT